MEINNPVHINTKDKLKPTWLVKVPKYLGERMMSLNNGSEFGEIEIGTDSQGGVNMNISFSEELINGIKDYADDTPRRIPRLHTVTIRPKDSKMHIIAIDDTDSAKTLDNVTATGKISDELFVQPVINSEYLLYKKSVKQNSQFAESGIKMINYFTELKKGEKYGNLKEMEALAKRRKKQLQDKKRERLEKSDILDIIFNAYEKHDYWTVKDLADFSGQPVAYIQELVSEICVLNKKDHKNTYELKPEYK